MFISIINVLFSDRIFYYFEKPAPHAKSLKHRISIIIIVEKS